MIDEIELLRLFRDEMPGPSTDAWARARSAIAAARSEEEPPSPRRHPGRRHPGRPRLFSIAGVGVAAAAVGGLLAILFPISPVTSPPGAASAQQHQETAYLVSRVGSALSASAQRNVVRYDRTVLQSGVMLTPVPAGLRLQARPGASSGQGVTSVVSWSSQGTDRVSVVAASGQQILDQRQTLAAGGGVMTVTVAYSDATWWRAATGPPPVPLRCGGPTVVIDHGGWPTLIRHELSCGRYIAAGRQRVDGVNAIKIIGSKGIAVLWVDPATYLPVRALLAIGDQRPQTDFRWLSTTPTSLAQLRVPVPAGFRQVPPPL
jgi:hypothetical protein